MISFMNPLNGIADLLHQGHLFFVRQKRRSGCLDQQIPHFFPLQAEAFYPLGQLLPKRGFKESGIVGVQRYRDPTPHEQGQRVIGQHGPSPGPDIAGQAHVQAHRPIPQVFHEATVPGGLDPVTDPICTQDLKGVPSFLGFSHLSGMNVGVQLVGSSPSEYLPELLRRT
jgi:hypothetical protein